MSARHAILRGAGALALAALLAACGGDGGTGLPKPSTVEVTAPSNPLFVGQSVQLAARAVDAAGGELASGEATWASGQPDVVQVSTTGLATAVGQGSATIRATINGRAGSMQLTVEAEPVATATVTMPGTSFAPANVLLRRGGSIDFVFPALAHAVNFQLPTTAGAPAAIPTTSNATVRRSFGTVGDFTYECPIHPGMTGTVRVR